MAHVETKKQARVTQKRLIAAHLKKHGSISSWEAIELYHCTRLGAYIYELRESGWDISTLRKTFTSSVTGNSGVYALYLLNESNELGE
ncbi:helix-turn-helix domain-containing protein [Dichelobacter nodosus]|uniref:Winged helix-turn-helix domain-containing protein n=1 Tax=Dichelobacter nodosus (strain VCS1703A) TaxID=246195 RepID=A5EUX7_DICNV|nr:helix-turn-helix domain-containing protein [Dichelobacter nodosus]ABQ13598.1 hypothetical protein DNO_0774 [Dichelobacter nodosus VCS1703A]KNZ40113.1 hypothetical protein AKG33_00080 [Dichelobacter nodosus]